MCEVDSPSTSLDSPVSDFMTVGFLQGALRRLWQKEVYECWDIGAQVSIEIALELT